MGDFCETVQKHFVTLKPVNNISVCKNIRTKIQMKHYNVNIYFHVFSSTTPSGLITFNSTPAVWLQYAKRSFQFCLQKTNSALSLIPQQYTFYQNKCVFMKFSKVLLSLVHLSGCSLISEQLEVLKCSQLQLGFNQN